MTTLKPEDIPSYEKMCRLSAELIKIKREENKKRLEMIYGCAVCHSLNEPFNIEGYDHCTFCGYVFNTKPTDENFRRAKKRRKDLTKYHWMRRFK